MLEIEDQLKNVVDRFSSLIRSVITKNLLKKDDVDLFDIEQEVKIKIWTVLKKGKKVKNFPSYIRRIAYTVTVDELRKMRKQNPTLEFTNLKNLYSYSNLNFTHKNSDSPELLLEDMELRSSLAALINSLAENRKQVLRLYSAGMSVEEICEFFNWDKTKVRHLLYRGIDDLKERIKSKNAKFL